MKFLFIVSLMLIGTLSAPGYAQVAETFVKVGGKYRVEEMKRIADDLFAVSFVAVEPSGKFDRLIFHTQHLHLGIEQGQVLQISADVRQVKSDGAEAEVAQVVLFLPSREGATAIWMLSKDIDPGVGALQLRDYLKLHSPQSDYRIL
jgi:hypothetical protein